MAINMAEGKLLENNLVKLSIERIKGSRLKFVHYGLYVDSGFLSSFVFHALPATLAGANIAEMLKLHTRSENIVFDWGILVDDSPKSQRIEILPGDIFVDLLQNSVDLKKIR